MAIGPAHQSGECLIDLRAFRVESLVEENLHDLRRIRLDAVGEHLARRTIDRQPITFHEGVPCNPHLTTAVINLERFAAGDADLAHLPCDEGGM